MAPRRGRPHYLFPQPHNAIDPGDLITIRRLDVRGEFHFMRSDIGHLLRILEEVMRVIGRVGIENRSVALYRQTADEPNLAKKVQDIVYRRQ